MYDGFSDDYDRFVNWQGRLAFEMPFLESQLRAAAAQRVLDAACGTGQHALALAQRGYQACGADLSEAMVARAHLNAEQAGVPLDFTAAGFGGLHAAFAAHSLFPFDALLCLGNSLPHALSAQALADALADFAACLRPGGVLLLQNRNFDALLRTKERWMEPQAHREGDMERIFLRFYDYDPDGLITFNILTLKRQGSGPWQQRLSATRLRPLPRTELGTALSQAGFDRLAWYGGLDGSPFDLAASANLVAVARRA